MSEKPITTKSGDLLIKSGEKLVDEGKIKMTQELHKKYISLDEAMAYLYHHEINTRIDCFWDGGFHVVLGDHMNGFTHGQKFEVDELYKAGNWLIEKAKQKHPKCEWRTL